MHHIICKKKFCLILAFVFMFKIVQSCFFDLRIISKNQIFPIFLGLSQCNLFFPRFDFCHASLHWYYARFPPSHSVVQYAARINTASRNRDHISPILASWLPVHTHIDFKIILLTFKALHDQAPNYIKDLLTPYEPGHPLRPARDGFLQSRMNCLLRSSLLFCLSFYYCFL